MNSIVLSGIWGVIMMFTGLLSNKQVTTRAVAIAGIGAILLVNILELSGYTLITMDTHGMISADNFSLLFNCITAAGTLVYFLLSGRDMEKVGKDVAEYYALLFFVFCGVSIVSSFSSLLMLFLGIEILSIPLYILTGSDRQNLKSNEASLKYFLMGAFSTGLMLMGIALIYGAKGSFAMDVIGSNNTTLSPMMSAGLLLLLFSLAFKVSAAPFHFWTPDVYDGAPGVFTSFMATIVKAAAFIAFIRLFKDCFLDLQGQWQLIVAIITAATLIIGNVTAVFQQSVKRMLAYSSIAQAGFMMFAIVALNPMAMEGLLLYTAAYSLATIGVFAVLIRMSDYTFEGFNGLGKHHPLPAGTITVFILSLAGIPATAGFMAKFYMLSSAVGTGKLLWLVILGVICAAISAYYYFRVIQAMYFKDGPKQEIQTNGGFRAVLLVTAGFILFLGLFPNWLIEKMYFFF